MFRKLFPWLFKKKVAWKQSSFICASMAEIYAEPTIIADASGIQKTSNLKIHSPNHQYEELVNVLIKYRMNIRYIHPGDPDIVASDLNTVYVYHRLGHDEVRLVGKNEIDIVSFFFKNGIVTVNGY